MKLVVDANIVFSALLASRGKTCELLFDSNLDLFSPEFFHTELDKHKDLILKKTDLGQEEFERLLEALSNIIAVIPTTYYGSKIAHAEKVCPDPEAVDYFALAIKLGCPLWSNDKILKRQDKVRIHFHYFQLVTIFL